MEVKIAKKARQYIRKTRGLLIGTIFGILIAVGVFMVMQSINKHQTAMPYEQSGVTISWLPSSVKRFKTEINTFAKQYDVDANMVAIIMTLESGGYTKASSGVASGLMQLTQPTAKDVAEKYLEKPVTKYDLNNVNTNIEFGAAYLAELRDTFCDYKDGPSWNVCAELVAAGYNGGPVAANNLLKGNGLEDVQTATYSRNAFNMWRERNAKKSPTYERWLTAGGQKLVDRANRERQ